MNQQGLNAKFVFDFDYQSFESQVGKAVSKLADMDTSAKSVQSRLDGMADKFAGKKIIQDATLAATAVEKLGGVASLTVNEFNSLGRQATEAVEKMAALGLKPPANLLKIVEAAASAEKEIARLKSGAQFAQERLDAMNSVSGRKLIQEMSLTAKAVADIGGTAKLTAKELERLGGQAQEAVAKMALMGKKPSADLKALADAGSQVSGSMTGLIGTATKLAGAFGIAFSVGQVVGFAKSVFDAADGIQRMSDQTGIGVVALQKLQAVGDASGNSIEDITSAVSQMQNRLSKGDSSAVAGIKEMGLSLSQLMGMKPEDQFMTIAKAIASIEDPAKQTQMAVAEFGRAGASILATIKSDFDEIAKSAVTMSADTVAALDAAGDAWQAFKRNATAAAGEFFGWVIAQNKEANREAERTLERLRDVNHVLEQRPDISKIKGPTPLPTGNPLAPLGMPSPEMMDYLDNKLKNITKSNEAGIAAQKKARDEAARADKQASDAAEKAAEAARKYVAEIIKQAESTDQLKFKTLGLADALNSVGGAKFVPSIKDIGATSLRSASDVDGLSGSVEELERGGRFTEATLRKMGTTIGILPNVTSQAGDKIEEARNSTEDWRGEVDKLATTLTQFAQISGDSFGGVVKDIANIVVSFNAAIRAADAYRDSVGAAQKSLALLAGATSVLQATTPHTTTKVDPVTNAVTIKTNTAATVLGGGVAGAGVGSAFGPIGTAVGFGVGSLIGWIRSEKAKKQINDVRQAFVDAAGGLGELNKRAHDSGANLDDFLNAKTPEEYNKAITALSGSIAKHEAAVKRISDGVTGLTSAWHDAGEYIPSDIQGMVDEMLTMNGLTEEQRKLLSDMSSSAEPDFKKLTALAADYGITLEGLGGKFQQANISSSAQQIFKDFDMLRSAGADVGGVLLGMSDEIQTLINNSKAFGAEIPENMRPLIQNLIEAGKLTDENGDALTDVSQINFGGTQLDKSTSAIVDAVHELRDALLSLPGAANTAADGVNRAFGHMDVNRNLGFTDPGVPDTPGGAGGNLLDFGSGALARLHRNGAGSPTSAETERVDAMAAKMDVLIAAHDNTARYLTQDFARETSRLLKQRVA